MNERITPLELAENCHRLAPQVKFLYLSAGDYWDSEGGSKASPPPNARSIRRDVEICYQRRKQEVDEAFDAYSAVPTPEHAAEIQNGLKKLFATNLRRLNWFWRILLGMKIEFACPELEKPYQLVDVARARVSEPRKERFTEADVTFTLPSGILDYALIQDKDLWNDARTSNRIYTRLNKPVSVSRVKLFSWLLTWHFIQKGLFRDMMMRLTWPLVCAYRFGRHEVVKQKDLQLFDDGAPAAQVATATD
jgi:hypothetical protein